MLRDIVRAGTGAGPKVRREEEARKGGGMVRMGRSDKARPSAQSRQARRRAGPPLRRSGAHCLLKSCNRSVVD